MDQALTRQKLEKLRTIVSEGDRVAILLQDDPDPDAMSSAIALRVLLGRNKLTTPIFAFTPVSRSGRYQDARGVRQDRDG